MPEGQSRAVRLYQADLCKPWWMSAVTITVLRLCVQFYCAYKDWDCC